MLRVVDMISISLAPRFENHFLRKILQQNNLQESKK